MDIQELVALMGTTTLNLILANHAPFEWITHVAVNLGTQSILLSIEITAIFKKFVPTAERI